MRSDCIATELLLYVLPISYVIRILAIRERTAIISVGLVGFIYTTRTTWPQINLYLFGNSRTDKAIPVRHLN